ncbi:phosphate acetyltransferase [Mycolicibacter senuensis]|uniref:Phosphate acetyltransferase n=1 Tax=Mycolicibacter senuensis TaxID=386913 RepID=A0A7I9XF49_9MYCO|nr:phosphate acetyltransferase [Mycolicibacter senuensis]MDQ2625879.1 phosphate acetyltransferase [Actinomycetota bacterium]ORW66666.1 phosphate acetyltransferase [Mycolicibacter senuensis]GFG68575.1 phosphate acetyltransferase [Mycolicibacter senuensis]
MTEADPAHASSIYLAAAEGGTGKAVIALGLLDLLAASSARVGVFRPIVRSLDGPDEQLELLLAHATATIDDDGSCRGVTYQQVYADREAALGEIVTRFHDVARRCDTVLVVGSDYSDVVNPSELTFNARIAVNLGAPLVLAINGHHRDAADIGEITARCLAEAAGVHARPAAVIANRCDPDRLTEITQAISAQPAAADIPAFAVPEVALLSAPTMAELCAALDGTVYSGDPELLRREALSVMVGGMTAENILERLTDGQVVIVPADRSDVLLALVNAHDAQGFPSLAGIILNGGLLPHPAIDKLVKGLRPTLPLIATGHRTYDTAEQVSHTGSRITVDSLRKIDTALQVMADHVDGAVLAERIRVPDSTVVTPQMFTYRLLERARADRRHIVLPEATDDRILLAAGRLLSRGIVDLTLLGVEDAVRRRGAELGVDLAAAQVVDPASSGLLDSFGAEYTRLRAHKGMTEDRAREIMRDISYFGTMMVQLGIADGMVSGAAHTTAHTIRPAFEIIRTAPGVSTVSSVFLMCLSDRVLAYGDCAVVPDPTVEQLADIAISSAATAAAFGIEPRVALLSYSTGESGAGAGVDKVRAATQLVHQRRPDLLADGPIQYDAAVDEGVAAAKLPDSVVAGRATVLVFPDLNTGNNTYKAVQRSAGAVAIGPVLQGLAKPVNDLSRGALVDDIVYTVAITAIQAQEVAR